MVGRRYELHNQYSDDRRRNSKSMALSPSANHPAVPLKPTFFGAAAFWLGAVVHGVEH